MMLLCLERWFINSASQETLMQNRFNELLLIFILLALAVVVGVDRVFVETSATQLISGLLTGLLIGGGIVFLIRLASRPFQMD
jgi:hypothetical protein